MSTAIDAEGFLLAAVAKVDAKVGFAFATDAYAPNQIETIVRNAAGDYTITTTCELGANQGVYPTVTLLAACPVTGQSCGVTRSGNDYRVTTSNNTALADIAFAFDMRRSDLSP